MSSPPQTPTHRRHPSSLDLSYSNGTPAHRRRSSAAGYSPVTPRSTHGGFDLEASPQAHFDHEATIPENGFGNLADELADAWDDEEDSEIPADASLADNAVDGERLLNGYVNGNAADIESARDSGVVLDSSPVSKATLSPTTVRGAGRHRRKPSRYDGSDYGDDSDLEASEGISAGLEARMAEVESLARRGMEVNGSEADQVVARVTERLRDLGSQAGVESGATRLTTAHSALTTHLHHQTRNLTSLTSSLFGPLSAPLSTDAIDEILPLLTTTLSLLPQPPNQPLYALTSLTHSTTDLLQTLSYLSDTLHMSRQSTSTATRRLKTVKEALAEWRRESELKEEGERWIEKGEWDRRLGEREAGRACGDVVGGFEKVCEGWRRRLEEGLGVAG